MSRSLPKLISLGRSVSFALVAGVSAALFGELYYIGTTYQGTIFWWHTWAGNGMFALLGGDLYGPLSQWQYRVCHAAIYYLPSALLGIALFSVLRLVGRRRVSANGETRCRKCHYILRGLTEARCPECGERI